VLFSKDFFFFKQLKAFFFPLEKKALLLQKKKAKIEYCKDKGL
jgi:hypothetical protein